MKKKEKLKEYLIANKIIFVYLGIYIASLILYKYITIAPFSTVHDVEIGFDSVIPFLPGFVYIYNAYTLIALGIGIYLFIVNIDWCKRYYAALIIARIIAYTVFIVYSTDVASIQPIVIGDDLTSKLMRMTYEYDTTINTFPSIHTSTMTIIIFATINSTMIKYNKAWVIALAVTIIATTVLVKQHVFLDIPSGIISGTASYYFGNLFVKKYSKPSKMKSLI